MDTRLTNMQIKATVQERWPYVRASATAIRDGRVVLGLRFGLPMIRQDLLQDQRFQRHQFGWDILVTNLHPAMILFSDQSRIVLGSHKGLRYIRRDQWNRTCSAAEATVPESRRISEAIGYGFKTSCHFCSNAAGNRFNQLVKTMDDRHRRDEWTFLQDAVSTGSTTATAWFLWSRCPIPLD
jgi:hypothetical protein